MKKIYTLFIALTGAVAMIAQNQTPVKFVTEAPKLIKPTSAAVGVPSKNNAMGSANFWIDYDLGDFNSPNGAAGVAASAYPGAGYRQYIWPFNDKYSGVTTSPEYAKFGSYVFRYFTVGFDSIYDTQNSMGYAQSQITSIYVDSVAFVVGQENNSGIDDSIKVSIVALSNLTNMTSYPSSTVYYTLPYIVSPGGQGISPLNQYTQPTWTSYPVKFQLGNGIKKFGIKVEYMGNKQDTCAMLVGFNDEGGNGSVCYDKPLPTVFAKAKGTPPLNGSTYVWNDYIAKNYAVTEALPTSVNGNTYVECDGTGGKSTGGLDGESIIQNAVIWAKITITTTGMEELKKHGVSLDQNMPNPFSGNTSIRYELLDNKNVKLDVFDITGNKVISLEEGTRSAGKHSINISSSDLKAGVYFYTLTAGDVRLTKKMTVVE